MKIKKYILTKKDDIKNIKVKPRQKEIEFTKEFISSIVGPRRAGKTYFLYYVIKKLNLKEDKYLFVNFEDYVDFTDPFEFLTCHKEIYGNTPEFIFLDEIQSLKSWKKFVYTLYESKRYHIFITGSSSKLLSKEIASQLRGRTRTIKIYPFSFKEIFYLYGIKKKKALSLYNEGKIKNILNKHLYTQFPVLVLEKSNPSDYFRDYIDLVVHKDIEERYGIEERFTLELFIKNVISSFTKEFSVHKVFNTLKSQGVKVSKKTLYNFQKILADVQFAFFLRKYSKSLRKTELSIPKVHLVDPGLYNFFVEKDASKTMENIVFLEFLKAGYEPNREIFHLKISDKEVDLLIKENNRVKYLINVTHASSFDEIENREYASLLKGYDLFKSDKPELIVITWDYEDEKELSWWGKSGKIKFVPLWKWLLGL